MSEARNTIKVTIGDLRKIHDLLTSALRMAEPETALVVDLVEAHDVFDVYLRPSCLEPAEARS